MSQNHVDAPDEAAPQQGQPAGEGDRPARKTITWRPSAEIKEWMEGRIARSTEPTGMSARITTEIALWRAVLAAELAQQHWTLDELEVIAAAMSSPVIPDTVSTSAVTASAAEVIDYARISGQELAPDLLSKLLRLGPGADHALRDAVARWWAAGADHTKDGWEAVGITPQDPS